MINDERSVLIKRWSVRMTGKKMKSSMKKRALCIESYKRPVRPLIEDSKSEIKNVFMEHICFIIRKYEKKSSGSENNETTLPPTDSDGDDETSSEATLADETNKELKPKLTLGLFDLEIESHATPENDRVRGNLALNNLVNMGGRVCHVTLSRDGEKYKHQILFQHAAHRQEFCEMVSKFKEKSYTDQRKRFVQLSQSDSYKAIALKYNLPFNFDSFISTKATFLFDIVGVTDLYRQCDPYVVVRLSDHVVHQTQSIPNEDDPVWTLRTGAYFITDINVGDMLRCNHGIHFTVYDKNFGQDNIVGTVCLSILPLYMNQESRIEYTLQRPAHGQKSEEKDAKIAIRCRHATEHDIKFIHDYEVKRRNGHISKVDYSTNVKGTNGLHSMFVPRSRDRKIDGKKVKQIKVRPYPDPKRPETTKWMTKEDINREVMKPSSKWIDTGSGKLAKIYLEVLMVTDFDNTDFGVVIEKNHTDPFVQVVYEDCSRKTDVIDDCLSPKWMPWTQRAFILNMLHPSSPISLGVFGFDKVGKNNFIGKASVDVTHFRPLTEYVLDYDLYDSLMYEEKERKGSIKIRIRIEVIDQRALALASLSPPPVLYVNTPDLRDFIDVSHSVKGTDDIHEYKIQNILQLVGEILAYSEAKEYIIAALHDLIMWRCAYHVQVSVPPSILGLFDQKYVERPTSKLTVGLPLDSIVAFTCGITLVENISLLPSYMFLFFGWSLTAVLNWRQNHPNPWYRSYGFLESLIHLVTNKELDPVVKITSDENKEAVKNFTDLWEDRFEVARNKAAIASARSQKLADELTEESEEFGSYQDLSTKIESKILLLNPVYSAFQLTKSKIYPHQGTLITICEWLRLVRNIVTWEEYYFSFYISVTCFTVAVVFFFIPWAFIIHQLARIFVWSLFGPWIKLYSIYSKKPVISKRELEKEERNKWEEMKDITVRKARIAHEEAAKKKSFKEFLFGKYMVRIPLIKINRHVQRPLSSSSATVIGMEGSFIAEDDVIREVVAEHKDLGQRLTGNMIPMLGRDKMTEADPNKDVSMEALVSSDKITAIKDIAKMSIIFTAAGVFSWVLVPFLLRV